MNGIICSSCTKGWLSSVSPKSNSVESGAHARGLRQHGGVPADEVLLHVSARATLAVALEGERGLGEPVDRLSVQLVRARRLHGAPELVRDRSHYENLLLADAQKVVVEGRSGDDVPRRLVEVRRLVHHHRRG